MERKTFGRLILPTQKFGVIFVCIFLSIGCANTTHLRTKADQKSIVLQKKLTSLDPSVDPKEALKLAEVSIQKAIDLAEEYRVVKPPWLHNVLVNYGYRERGLCFEWANDIYLSLLDLRFTSMDIHLVVSRLDTRREHNSIVVTARGQSITNGIVLDAWRHSGQLWFGPVVGDKYQWELLPESRINPGIKKKLIEVNPYISGGSSERPILISQNQD